MEENNNLNFNQEPLENVEPVVPVQPIEDSQPVEPIQTIENQQPIDTIQQNAEIEKILASIQPQESTIEPVAEEPVVEQTNDSFNPDVERVLASIQPQEPLNQQPVNNSGDYNRPSYNNTNNNGNGNGGVIVSLILIILLVVAVVGFVVNNPFAGEKVENSSTPTPSATPTSTPTLKPTATPINTQKPTSTTVPSQKPVPTPTATPTPDPVVGVTKTITCSGKGKFYDVKTIIVQDDTNKKAVQVTYDYKLTATPNTEGLTEDEKLILMGFALAPMEFEKFKSQPGVTYRYNETTGMDMYFDAKRTSSADPALIKSVFEDFDGMSSSEIAAQGSVESTGITCSVN